MGPSPARAPAREPGAHHGAEEVVPAPARPRPAVPRPVPARSPRAAAAWAPRQALAAVASAPRESGVAVGPVGPGVRVVLLHVDQERGNGRQALLREVGKVGHDAGFAFGAEAGSVWTEGGHVCVTAVVQGLDTVGRVLHEIAAEWIQLSGM